RCAAMDRHSARRSIRHHRARPAEFFEQQTHGAKLGCPARPRRPPRRGVPTAPAGRQADFLDQQKSVSPAVALPTGRPVQRHHTRHHATRLPAAPAPAGLSVQQGAAITGLLCAGSQKLFTKKQNLTKIGTMRTILLSILLLGSVEVQAQALSIRLEKQSLPFAIGVQSFAVASYDQYLLIVGGRTEGLHKRRPFESFANAGSNRELILFDRSKLQSVHFDVNILDYPYRDQFQSTNMAFWQDGDRLILAGGYGYGPVTGRHTTYPFLSVIDVPCLIDKLRRGDIPDACMRSLEDPRMAITGGQLARLDDGRYYLVGGQYFDGLYNPMGPTHGPGFTQAYSNEIRRFFLRENAD